MSKNTEDDFDAAQAIQNALAVEEEIGGPLAGNIEWRDNMMGKVDYEQRERPPIRSAKRIPSRIRTSRPSTRQSRMQGND